VVNKSVFSPGSETIGIFCTWSRPSIWCNEPPCSLLIMPRHTPLNYVGLCHHELSTCQLVHLLSVLLTDAVLNTGWHSSCLRANTMQCSQTSHRALELPDATNRQEDG